jgi:hypothetical protein
MFEPPSSMNPDSQTIHQLLQTASTSDPTRSQTARLQDYLDSIESALASGVSRASVIQILSANGFDISLNSFASALRRVRQRRAKTGAPPSRSVQSSHSLQTSRAMPLVEHSALDDAGPLSSSPASPQAGSHNPADLNKIFSHKPDLGALAKLARTSHS